MSSEQDDRTFEALVTGAVTGAVTTPFDSGRSTAPTLAQGRRFEPGAIIAGRYRLVALLGRGGMGEVYRADDLTLDLPVALKFLPTAVGSDERSLARFHNELRVARQVSHKNVCRLYDIGEADGHRFLTMEYIDGEDLSSLLRRIGRLPQDKAVQIARQLCAGVAAAHDRGVLHRDLKPANVMIDGQGDVRITDFGIATAASDAAHEFVGTPQYMAPELFAGQAASIRSDIYALGLTLYEVFTGRRAYESKTLEGLKEQHQTGTLPSPTTLVRDLDPAIERVILRCLEKDPERRPGSALAAAAMLPGSDALADALAAGETPSPELLAAAGETEAMGVGRGVGVLAALLAGVLIVAGVSGATSFARRVPLEKSAEVLTDRAETIVRLAGYGETPVDRASEYFLGEDYLDWIRFNSEDPYRWDVLSDTSGVVRFWYRSSLAGMLPINSDGLVTVADPPFVRPGMRMLILDSSGRLLRFRVVPPQVDGEPADTPFAWNMLFDAAGLDMATFMPDTPQWAPPDFADARLAWTGPLPGRAGVTLRVEAASVGGRPVAFSVNGPWTVPVRGTVRRTGLGDKLFSGLVFLFVAVILLSAFVLSRRHIQDGRADWRGARRVGLWLAVPLMLAAMVRAHHTWNIDGEIELFFASLGGSGMAAVAVFAMYLAMEPYLRKFWPHSLLGWSRLITGHVRDARIGADVFAGMAGGILLFANDLARAHVLPLFGWAGPYHVYGRRVELLSGTGNLIFRWSDWARASIEGALLIVLLIVLLRLGVRRNWLALSIAAFLIIFQGLNYTQGSGPWIFLFAVLGSVLNVVIAVRFGLLALVVARFVWNVLYGVPFTLDVSHWSAAPSNWSLMLLAALAMFALYASRAGQPLFGRRQSI